MLQGVCGVFWMDSSVVFSLVVVLWVAAFVGFFSCTVGECVGVLVLRRYLGFGNCWYRLSRCVGMPQHGVSGA